MVLTCLKWQWAFSIKGITENVLPTVLSLGGKGKITTYWFFQASKNNQQTIFKTNNTYFAYALLWE